MAMEPAPTADATRFDLKSEINKSGSGAQD
jgi:hypothetical protein